MSKRAPGQAHTQPDKITQRADTGLEKTLGVGEDNSAINPKRTSPVVGMGVSVGGLSACGKLPQEPTVDTGMAFVLVLPLDEAGQPAAIAVTEREII